MVLKAREACRVSIVPVSGIGGAFKSLPSRSAAADKRGKRRGHASHDPHRHGENDDRHDTHRQEELTRERRAALGQRGRERKPLAIRQGHRDLQIAEAAESSEARHAMHHRAAPHHRVPASERRPVRQRRRHARLPRRSERQLIDEKVLDRLRNRRVVVCRRRWPEARPKARRGSVWSLKAATIRSRHSRGVSCTSRVRLAMRCAAAKTADRAHRLLAIRGVDPRSRPHAR